MKILKVEYSYDKNDRINLSKDIPKSPGTYILFDKNLSVLYIGESKNFRSRLTSHISKNNTGRNINPQKGDYGFNTYLPLNIVDYYILIKSDNVIERQMIESFLIYFLSPKFNRICMNCENKYKEKEKINT